MADSSQTNPIDVEAEADKSEKMIKLLQSQSIYIPERYYVKMAQKGLLNQFVDLIQRESTKNNFTKKLLDKHRIIIPAEFYQELLQTDLFQALLDAVHDVDREQEIERVNFIKENLYSKTKRSHDFMADSDSEQDKTQSEIINERSTKKRKDNSIGTLDSPPSTNADQSQNGNEDDFFEQLD